MSLQIIYGRCGSGKTAAIFDIMKKEAANGGKILLLTPEHISLAAERRTAADEKLRGSTDIIVTGFNRLASKVFSKTGPVTARFTDVSAKVMMIKRLLLKNEKKLAVLGVGVNDDGFAKCVFDTINSLKSSCILPDDLRTAANGSDNLAVKLKLCDIALIYEKYNAEFTGGVYDSTDNLSLLCEKIEKHNLFCGYTVLADGFNGFSKLQYNVIEILMKNAKSVTVTCPTDTVENENNALFFRGVTMADKLYKAAYQIGTEVLPNIFLDGCARLENNEELKHLEQNLYTYPAKPYDKSTENIMISAAASYASEAENAARKIYALCRDKGYRYKDFAVVCRKPEIYISVIKKAFGDYDIPIFANEKISLLSNPFIHDILSAFDVIINNFSIRSVVQWIKGDFHTESRENICLLENYITAAGSNEKMWRGKLKYKAGMDDEDFETVCGCAAVVLKGILEFSDNLKGRKTVKSVTEAFKRLIEVSDCENYILRRYDELVTSGRLQNAQALISAYNGLISVVNQMYEIFGESSITAEKYLSILRSGLAGSEIGQIPACADCVSVSEPDLFKEEKKIIFLLGANDGVLPKGYINDGLLSDDDKKLLCDAGFDAPDNNIIKHKAESYLIYSVLSSASDKIYISYSTADYDGEPLEPSQLISRLKSIFPKISFVNEAYENTSGIDFADAVIPAFNRLAAGDFGANGGQALLWFKNNRPDLYDIIAASREFNNNPRRLREEIVKGLYGAVPQYSISKAEQYNRCAFSYFLNYGLKARPRLEYKITPADTGTIMHEIIEKYITFADQKGFFKISENECADIGADLTREVMKKYLSDNYFESAQGRIMLKKISKIMRGLLWNITRFYVESGFELYGCEVDFGGEGGSFSPIDITLDDGTAVKLTGKIDRVDILMSNGKCYVNVVDYKSSDKTVDYAGALYGIQLQLPVYIDAICRFLSEEKKVITVPAAMLYCKIDYPPASGDRSYSQEKIEEEIKKNMKMKGVVAKYDETEGAMGGAFAVKPDITGSQLDRMCKYAYKKIKSTISEIMTGNISIMPAVSAEKSSCDYCDFASVCEFDPMFDNKSRYISKIKREEFFEYVGKMDK